MSVAILQGRMMRSPYSPVSVPVDVSGGVREEGFSLPGATPCTLPMRRLQVESSGYSVSTLGTPRELPIG